MTAVTRRPVELECGHTLWFETVPDTMDETLWCPRCQKDVEIAPTAAKLRGVWVGHPDLDFRSRRESLRCYTGMCSVDGCGFEIKTNHGWFVLRDKMHQHHMRTHTRFGGVDIQYEKYTGNTPPF